MKEQIIPPQFTEYQWNKMSHSDRIVTLHKYSNDFTLSLEKITLIKNEIKYYQNIQAQIKILTE